MPHVGCQFHFTGVELSTTLPELTSCVLECYKLKLFIIEKRSNHFSSNIENMDYAPCWVPVSFYGSGIIYYSSRTYFLYLRMLQTKTFHNRKKKQPLLFKHRKYGLCPMLGASFILRKWNYLLLFQNLLFVPQNATN